jgi:RNA polymerase sigma factor (sigma-70 family)
MPELPNRPRAEDLRLLTSVIRDVARVRRLSLVDRQDFAQSVQLRFVERNYVAFARFRGESSLRTYLTVVVTRLLLDWRVAKYGKWRPSAAALRNGPVAVRLDRLMNREGYTRDEAIEILKTTTDVAPRELEIVAERVPWRPRPRMVEEDVLRPLRAVAFRDPIQAREQYEEERRQSVALGRACRQLSLEDQRLIALRYKSALTVREISQLLQTDQKALYRRFDRLVIRLRFAVGETTVGDVGLSH